MLLHATNVPTQEYARAAALEAAADTLAAQLWDRNAPPVGRAVAALALGGELSRGQQHRDHAAVFDILAEAGRPSHVVATCRAAWRISRNPMSLLLPIVWELWMVSGQAYTVTDDPMPPVQMLGDPPFVRNQDLPLGWRTRVAAKLTDRSGVALSGLANAWQYFFLLALLSTSKDGVCALVVPYEWVSRPSVAPLRRYIRERGWDVQVYRLTAEPFESVLTTASITIIDKGGKSGRWSYFDTGADGIDVAIANETGGDEGLVAYTRVSRTGSAPRAMRGLSPGTQRVLILTEGERARLGLKPGRDVVRCATTLRTLGPGVADLDVTTFDSFYRNAGRRCWLIVPEAAAAGGSLAEYLDSVDPAEYATQTCLDRERWWEFKMPDAPDALVATCFKGNAPKAVLNGAGAIAVGGVAGVHGAGREGAAAFLARLGRIDLRKRIVAHANELFKLEIGQLNTLLSEVPDA